MLNYLYYYGARYYSGRESIWLGVDPKADEFPGWSPYNYCLDNPIKHIDQKGENPIVVAALGITAADAFLIATGIVTTGIILHKAHDGSFAINDDIVTLFKNFNPGYQNQQKNERTQKENLNKSQAKVQKSIDENVGKPSPDGTPDPKRDPSKIGKVVIKTGLAAEAVKSFAEMYQKDKPTPSKSNANNQSNCVELKAADSQKKGDTQNPFNNPSWEK